jgi:hypothetical protein
MNTREVFFGLQTDEGVTTFCEPMFGWQGQESVIRARVA